MAPVDYGLPAAAGLATVLLAWLCAAYPAELPAWAPWDFSWTEFLAVLLALGWYARGVALARPDTRPPLWRQALFVTGVLLIYAVLLTHLEYMAQHMFFLNRLQHMVMHHLAPFLIALAWPGDTIARGMPAPLRRAMSAPPLLRALRVVQHPVPAAVLFSGLIGLWLIPAVHVRAMIDPQLYSVMNWSMVLDGLLFWFLVLDPRPLPQARVSYAARMLATIAVMFPQILMGASITFTTTSIYPFYDLCGRLFPSIGAMADQHIGGTVVWIPSAMMSSLAFMLILNHIRIDEDRRSAAAPPAPGAVRASAWTGR